MNLQQELDLPFPLRPYQEEGFNFLKNSQRALLGDDMGLGKTVQAIVALKEAYEEKVSLGFDCRPESPNYKLACGAF